MARTNGGAKLSTPIENVIDLYATRNNVPHDIAEDIVYECQSVMYAFLSGEIDYYDDLAEIVWDYLSLDSRYIQWLL